MEKRSYFRYFEYNIKTDKKVKDFIPQRSIPDYMRKNKTIKRVLQDYHADIKKIIKRLSSEFQKLVETEDPNDPFILPGLTADESVNIFIIHRNKNNSCII